VSDSESLSYNSCGLLLFIFLLFPFSFLGDRGDRGDRGDLGDLDLCFLIGTDFGGGDFETDDDDEDEDDDCVIEFLLFISSLRLE
jgi:hypothetical protein